MEVLPAIDLRDGRVVRLQQGDYDRRTDYSDSPQTVARELAAAGARWIHVVDLDASKSGRPTNTAAIAAIRSAVEARIEQGGGARSEEAIDAMLAAGADRVVVGSAAMEDWAWFERLVTRVDLAGKLALGLDARAGKLAVRGWTRQLKTSAVEVARRTAGWPLAVIVYTDIARDGMMTGPNLSATAEILAATDVPVIASGGVARVEDVLRCKEIGCAGVIIGRAYYQGAIDLAEAIRLAR
ncbi:MAG: 1-(5-phosphoribosyl)-5-[(5-phosphoribosylamino)methylideneamino]imidazole-4-carboxamide isomerase [Phycisphaerae bacterium]|nr:1-(5-phosphoribosyl)-5-[(5-phosphoribosylamino)methylideneamino]imidazole-4-carboxamide isomerase [Phycisphaerae bacterium]